MMREDWVQVNIESVFKKLDNGKEINQGWSPQCKNYPSSSEDIWGVLKTTAIQKNEFWDHENKELPKDKEARAHLEVKAGDIILTCAGPRNRCGVACTVTKTRPKLLLSGKMYRFRPDERVMTTEFLTFFLQTQESWSEIDKMKTGTSDSGLNLTQGRFRKLPIKIAPLPEQRSIVTKIEELFSDLDKGVADLKKAQDQLKVYRQSVLKKAFEGDWEIKLLEEVAKWGSGGTPSRSNKSFYSGNIPWIKTGELGDKYISRSEEKITEEAIKKSSAKIFPPGSVAIAMYGATIGKTSIFSNYLSTNQACAVAQPIDGMVSEYLYYYLLSQKMDFINKGKGGAQPNISQTILKKHPIPVPLKEQQVKIVQMIESHLSICDKVENNITESLEKAEALRQSILKKAFEGNLLTTQEIEKCKTASDYEPASVLLEKIKMK